MLFLAAALACDAPYTREALVAELSRIRAANVAMEEAAFDEAGARLRASVRCLDRTLPLAVYAATYRAIGAWHFLSRDERGEAARWFRSAIEIEPNYGWDADELPLNHPMRYAWDTERGAADDAAVAVEGYGLAAGEWYLDGRRWTDGGATIDRPHLLQRMTEDGTVTTWLVDGNAFPVDALARGGVAAVAVKDDGFGVVQGKRVRPTEKTPLLIAGAAGVAAAGGIYAAALLSRQGFEAAGTTEEVEARALRTNILVLGAGGVLAAGLGVGWWGVILDGGGGFGYQHRF